MNPVWMLKTRYQIIPDASVGQRAFKNYGEVARTIWKEEGLPGFFKGITASYVGCFEGAVQWIVYEKLKAAFSKLPEPAPSMLRTSGTLGTNMFDRRNADTGSKTDPATVRSPTPAQLFLAAAASKFAAIVATYPHEVVRTRLREQATSGVFKYRGFVGTLRTIAKEEGVR
jgi:solute carrier family 25 protein 33/36